MPKPLTEATAPATTATAATSARKVAVESIGRVSLCFS
jgi:hypothetical protein